MDNGIYSRFAIAYAKGDILSPGQTPRPLDTIDPLNLVVGIGYREPAGDVEICQRCQWFAKR